MEENYERDNIIQWIFEKIFDQLTINSTELSVTPFEKIKSKTFGNHFIYKLINKLTGKSIEQIKKYLTNIDYQEKFLFSKIKKKLNVQILLNNLDKIKYLLTYGYKIDTLSLQLIVLNDRLEILKYILEYDNKIILNNELLMYCSEFGYEETYFYLVDRNLKPNISIFNKAARGNSLNIIKNITKYIGISNKILISAFQTNNTEIILYLISKAGKEKMKIDQNLITYPVLNNNFILIKKLEDMKLISWYPKLYYSALLSGSMKMIRYLESKMPYIHDNHLLDTSKNNIGCMSLLLEEIMYVSDQKKYFSHTMNYAIQSESLDVVKYIYQKGYGITASNFITAIKQGPLDVLLYLCEKYNKSLPHYFIYYFGVNSFLTDKIKKAQILIDSGLLNINPNHKFKIQNYKKETAHIEMISQTVQIIKDENIDTDYLMNYQLFFVPIKNHKFNHSILIKTRIYLELNNMDELINIFSSKYNETDQQIIIDVLYLFGNFDQIKKLHPLVPISIIPSLQILMEIICYRQINKFCYLIYNKLLTDSIIIGLHPIITMLSDNEITLFFQKINNFESQVEYIILSGKRNIIYKWLSNHKVDQQKYLNKNILADILLLDDMDIIKKIEFPEIIINELVTWSKDFDLLEIHNYLKSV